MTRTCLARAAFAVSALALAAPLSAQTVSVLVTEGDVVPGFGVVMDVRGVQVNDAGEWVVALTDTVWDDALLRGSAVVLQTDQALGALPAARVVGFDDLYGLSATGTTVCGALADQSFGPDFTLLAYEGDTFVYEGMPVVAPTAPPGSVYRDLYALCMPTDGDAYARWTLTVAGQPHDAIVRTVFDVGSGAYSEEVLCQEGQLVPGQALPVLSISAGGMSLAANVAGDVVYVFSTGSFPNNHRSAIYRNDEVVVEDGMPCSAVPGRAWDPSGGEPVAIDTRGGVALRADLDDGDAVIVHRDRLVRREGQAVPELGGGPFVPVLTMNLRASRAGEVLHGGRVGPAYRYTVFLEDEVIATEFGALMGQVVLDVDDGPRSTDMSPDGRYVAFVATLADGLERCFLLDRGARPTDYCLGDGASAAPCPCGNETPTERAAGCENSQGRGAYLTARGQLVAGADDATFAVYDARPHQPGMLVQGEAVTNVPFKDGLLCVGNPTERIEVVFTDANGYAETSGDVALEGNVGAFQTRYYQLWYRDPTLSLCGSGSNLTQGLEVSWQ